MINHIYLLTVSVCTNYCYKLMKYTDLRKYDITCSIVTYLAVAVNFEVCTASNVHITSHDKDLINHALYFSIGIHTYTYIYTYIIYIEHPKITHGSRFDVL